MRQRLQKVLAEAGITSRRRAEEMIARGEVLVNGAAARLGVTVDAEVDTIEVNGTKLSLPGKVYVALNKPIGYVSSARSNRGEPTVLDLVALPERVLPVGRLDKDTSGLLLLTNDGEWANLVAHPRYGVEKEYEVRVQGNPSAATLRRLRGGVQLADGLVTSPARVERMHDRAGSALLRVTLTEGKKRQIRQMCRSVGHPVLELRRVRVGPVRLATLGVGAWRYLQPQEVDSIREHARRSAQQSRTRPRPSDRH